MLNKKLIKILKICTNTYAAVWTLMVLWLCYLMFPTGRWCTEPSLLWPFIHMFLTHLNIYKFYKMLKINNNLISKTQCRDWLLASSRDAFFLLSCLSVLVVYVPGVILFAILTLTTIYCIYYMKKIGK